MWFTQRTLYFQEDNSNHIDLFDSGKDALPNWLANPMKITTPSEFTSKLTLVADSVHLYPLTEPEG